jgi:hypothetical protein
VSAGSALEVFAALMVGRFGASVTGVGAASAAEAEASDGGRTGGSP